MRAEPLSADDVRTLALAAQDLIAPRPRRPRSHVGQVAAVTDLLERLGAVQLDTISVLARSHELVPMARLGAIARPAIHEAFWGTAPHDGDAACIEYWSHAACVLPVASWPWFAVKRRRAQARDTATWHGHEAQAVRRERRRVLRELDREGALTANDLGGAKVPGQWWSWSATKVALEELLSEGEVVCTRRIGWRRVYDLPGRALPAEVLSADTLDDEECLHSLVRDGARVVGVGTAADIADVHRIGVADVRRHATDAGLVPVAVDGWPAAWAHPESLALLPTLAGARSVTTLLSPFDSLIWFRDRTERMFGMTHRLEAYTPEAKRVHGYFAMPVLHRGALVARVDPSRDGRTLVARRVTFEQRRGRVPQSFIEGTARALRDAATWVGADDVAVQQVIPSADAARLRDALRA